MTALFAALPMYDWPEARSETDAEWARLRDAFRTVGIDAPETIVRRNAELPPVPGGIRDAEGAVIAADPATLPPDELDFHALWLHPALLFAQTCWGPMELGLARHVQVVGQPSYDGFEGGRGELYSSAVVMRKHGPSPSPLWGGSASDRSEAKIGSRGGGEREPGLVDTPPPRLTHAASRHSLTDLPGRATGLARPSDPHKGEGGVASIPLDLIRGKRFTYNSTDSMSGFLALSRDLRAMGESLDMFSSQSPSGGHRASIVAVAEGREDVAAIDCRSWALAQRFEPAAAEVRVVGWTALRKGLPYIASRHLPAAITKILQSVL